MLRHLARETNVDWSRVAAFHLDEYIGLPRDHGASFHRYLKERFVDRLAVPIGVFHYINPDEDPEAECKRLSTLIAEGTIDVAFIGIGENGHLAFNDPPADFETEAPYLVVSLDEACRRQQWGEGWFSSLEAVPREAVSRLQIGISRTIRAFRRERGFQRQHLRNEAGIGRQRLGDGGGAHPNGAPAQRGSPYRPGYRRLAV